MDLKKGQGLFLDNFKPSVLTSTRSIFSPCSGHLIRWGIVDYEVNGGPHWLYILDGLWSGGMGKSHREMALGLQGRLPTCWLHESEGVQNPSIITTDRLQSFAKFSQSTNSSLATASGEHLPEEDFRVPKKLLAHRVTSMCRLNWNRPLSFILQGQILIKSIFWNLYKRIYDGRPW